MRNQTIAYHKIKKERDEYKERLATAERKLELIEKICGQYSLKCRKIGMHDWMDIQSLIKLLRSSNEELERELNG